MKLTIINQQLFYRKLMTLTIATIALVPLIHLKLHFPAFVYLGTLLLLHLYIFYVYFSGVAWREFLQNKKELVVRLSAIAFFIYLLTVLSFTGNTSAILLNLAGAFALHVCILVLMMASRASSDTA